VGDRREPARRRGAVHRHLREPAARRELKLEEQVAGTARGVEVARLARAAPGVEENEAGRRRPRAPEDDDVPAVETDRRGEASPEQQRPGHRTVGPGRRVADVSEAPSLAFAGEDGVERRSRRGRDRVRAVRAGHAPEREPHPDDNDDAVPEAHGDGREPYVARPTRASRRRRLRPVRSRRCGGLARARVGRQVLRQLMAPGDDGAGNAAVPGRGEQHGAGGAAAEMADQIGTGRRIVHARRQSGRVSSSMQ